MRGLTLNDGKGDTVNEQDKIRTSVVLPVQTVYGVFLCYMEQVVLRMIPVDVFQIEAQELTFTYGFLIAFAQQEGVVDPLAGANEAISERFVQVFHSSFNIGRGKFIFDTTVGIAVELAQLATEDIFQQDVVVVPAL